METEFDLPTQLSSLTRGTAKARDIIKELSKYFGYVYDKVKEKGSSSVDLVQVYRRLYDAEEALTEDLKVITKMKALFKEVLIPEAYERENISTLTTSERDRVSLSQNVRASILLENRAEVYKWLRANGHGALIVETINAQTLSAWVKAQTESMSEIPALVQVNIITSASLTRGQPTI